VGARRELERRAERLDALVRELDALPDDRARRTAVEAFRALLDLHAAALERLLELAGPEDSARLAGDPAVGGMLLLHDLHPVPFEQRVQRALDGVRPYLGSHGGGVQVLDVREGVVRLLLEGSCHGCPSSTATVRYAIEQAIMEAAPDAAGIEVVGAAEPPPAAGFVPLTSIGGPAPRPEWAEVPGLEDLTPGTVLAMEVAGERIAFCLAAGERYAYRDRCPGCGAALEAARVDAAALACPGCGRRFDVCRAGRGLDDAALHLEPVPLVVRDGAVRVSLPSAPARVG
jgi:Fe-S cluster biogenesis protein NfuA/nitrite reductase/ring-hydroxylating ferredoxin subunit